MDRVSPESTFDRIAERVELEQEAPHAAGNLMDSTMPACLCNSPPPCMPHHSSGLMREILEKMFSDEIL